MRSLIKRLLVAVAPYVSLLCTILTFNLWKPGTDWIYLFWPLFTICMIANIITFSWHKAP